MFKGYQDTSSQSQFKGFPNLNMQGAVSAYGFSGVSFWLDAAYGLNTQTNLGAVSSWQQRVGRGTFVQATAANQPRLILSDANYNGYPSVESVSNVRFMIADLGLKLNTFYTVAIISKVNASNFINGIIGVTNISAANNQGFFDGGTDSAATGFGYNRATYQIGAGQFQGTTETVTSRIKVITTTSIVINGVNENTSSGFSIVNELTNLFRLGSQSSIYSSIVGTIAEIIAFPYSMTATDAIALSDRINQKYALY